MMAQRSYKWCHGMDPVLLFYHDCLVGGLCRSGGIDQLSSLGAVPQGSTGATCRVSIIVVFKSEYTPKANVLPLDDVRTDWALAGCYFVRLCR